MGGGVGRVILRGALLRRTISVRLSNQTDGRRMPQMQPLNLHFFG